MRILLFLLLASAVAFSILSGSCASVRQADSAAEKPVRDDAAAEKLGWRLGVQAWTFRDRTACEAIDTAAKLGLKYIELYSGQALCPELKDAKVAVDMSEEQRSLLQKKLKSAGVKAVSFGVVGFDNNEAEARKIFDFAKAMRLENISCEPEPDAYELVDKLCNEYKINAAIHNHPKPARYWSPEVVLGAIAGRSKRMGACADTGHWPRSGLVPLDCLKQYEGHIIELHFKDITDGVDRPWGTGKGDARGMLAELQRQKFKGLINVEYEDGAGPVLEANVARCIEFFDNTARELSQ